MSLIPNGSSVQCPVCHASHRPVKGELQDGVYAADCQNCGHFFKFRASGPVRSSFTVKINGQDYTIGNEYPGSTSLLSFLREKGISRGTKVMCIEGGCGVCLVSATLTDALTNKPRQYSVNSCCVPLLQCDGWEITTIEGLGSTRTSVNPVQDRLAHYNGSQCGFCTPAHVLHMYNLLKTNPKPTMVEVEDAIDSTVCRCTGYRAILDAMKSFSTDAGLDLPGGLVDIEELDKNICKKTGKPCSGKCSDQSKSMLHVVTDGAQWLKPTNKQELYTLLNQHKGDNYRLIFGNTGFGVFKDIGEWNYDILIDIRGVTEFYILTDATTITVGANITVTNMIEYLSSRSSSTNAHFSNICQLLGKIGSTSIRNMGSWAGNLMMKHLHPEFVSDIYVVLESLKATVVVGDSAGKEVSYTIADFLKLDMTGKVITMAIIPKVTNPNVNIRTFKVMPRSQDAHAYVSCGINMEVDASQNFLVVSQPVLAYVGISKDFTRATTTETFLTGKALGDGNVLKGALETLYKELVPDDATSLTPTPYRKSLGVSLFYKYVLGVCNTVVNTRFQSGSVELMRPLSSGRQSYDTRKDEYPVTQPITKRDALLQTTGEAVFINDIPPRQDEVYAAFVISSVANAEIDVLDPSPALNMPGVLRFISAKDIPSGGHNNWYPPPRKQVEEELFSTGKIYYAGQSLGLIVAESQDLADQAAEMVKVTYKNIQTPLLNVEDSVQQKAFFTPAIPPLVTGDPSGAISKSQHSISGQVITGDQYHYQLETQISLCYPTETGVHLFASTQWINFVQDIVGRVLNLPNNSVTVEVKRIGGAFGSKITRNTAISAACAVAAYVMQRPVRLMLNIHTNMKMIGKRHPCLARYQVGFSDTGVLNGVELDCYVDCGAAHNDSYHSVTGMEGWLDNAYYCQNWRMTPYLMRTNKPPNIACRSPGSAASYFIIESIMDHVAKTLDKDPLEVRKINLYKHGQVTPAGMTLSYCNVKTIVQELETSADISQRKLAIQQFNTANRWKKQGISVLPLRFGMTWHDKHFNTLVDINNADGSIAIYHGGVAVGQGINTKVAQVCAYELDVPMDIITVGRTSTTTNSNSSTTGGSTSSEVACLSVIECCKMLKERMAPIKAKMTNPTWKDLVTECYASGVDITARYMTELTDQNRFAHYNVYGAVCSQVELDVLTGESLLTRVDILYDCGESINPDIDIGQAEGGFVMGVGHWLHERLIYDPVTGENLTANTWEYKPPMGKDIPVDFRIEFLKNSVNPIGVLGSKAVGEPPLVMAASALLAIKHAIEAARKEINKDVFFSLYGPATRDVVQQTCLTEVKDMSYGN